MAGKKRKNDGVEKFYAVKCGMIPGIYMTWAECQAQTSGYSGAIYKSFESREAAEDFIAGRKAVARDGEPVQEKYYAVAVGRDPGIYTEWEDASRAITGWKGPKYRRFETRAEAANYIRLYGNPATQASLEPEASEPARKKTRRSSVSQAAVARPRESAVQNIYTDGSSLANGRAGASAGVGVYFGIEDPRNVSERLEGEPQTNQRAELTAILRALQAVSVDQDVRIISDSKYSISCVTQWYTNWERNGWKTQGKDVKNRDLIEAIRAKIQDRDDSGTQTMFQWVKGHGEDMGNAAADRLAVLGARMRSTS